MKKHGQVVDSGSARWCETCNQNHGIIYACKNYPEEILKEISIGQKQFREFAANDKSDIGFVWRMFAGVKEGNDE